MSTPLSPNVVLVELLFFAYRDFVAEADALLEPHGFGRAHHRAVHFVNRQPGLKVSELLDILGITKQSLARVLRELLDQGFMEQKEDHRDRRARLLFLTPKGQQLADDLLLRQTRRMENALNTVGEPYRPIVEQFLFGVMQESSRGMAVKLTGRKP